MADDTREDATSAPIGLQRPPEKKRDNSQGRRGIGSVRPPPSANAMGGGTQNTAGGQVKPANAIDAAKSIKLEEFQEIHKKPCVRDAFLTGIPSGVAVGAVWVLLGAPIKKSANWAVGSFCALSFFTYEYCQIKRGMEKDGMKRAVQLMDNKREEKMKTAREERRKAKEEAGRRVEEQKKSQNWWKFW